MEEASKEKEDLKRCGCLALILVVGICWNSDIWLNLWQ